MLVVLPTPGEAVHYGGTSKGRDDSRESFLGPSTRRIVERYLREAQLRREAAQRRRQQSVPEHSLSTINEASSEAADAADEGSNSVTHRESPSPRLEPSLLPLASLRSADRTAPPAPQASNEASHPPSTPGDEAPGSGADEESALLSVDPCSAVCNRPRGWQTGPCQECVFKGLLNGWLARTADASVARANRFISNSCRAYHAQVAYLNLDRQPFFTCFFDHVQTACEHVEDGSEFNDREWQWNRTAVEAGLLGTTPNPPPPDEPPPSEALGQISDGRDRRSSRDTVPTITIDAEIPRRLLEERFASVNVDMSILTDSVCNFSHPTLSRLVGELAPMTIHVGGPTADTVYYDMTDQPPDTVPAPYKEILTKSSWEEFSRFVSAVNLDTVLTLNAGAGPRNKDGKWVSDNALAIVEYNKAKAVPVIGYEFGSEPNMLDAHFGPKSALTPERYCQDFQLFARAIRSVSPRALIGGPSVAFLPDLGELSPVFNSFVEMGGPISDVISFHFYPTVALGFNDSLSLSKIDTRLLLEKFSASGDRLSIPSVLQQVTEVAKRVKSAASMTAPQAKVWLDETGSALGVGGQQNVSDRFADAVEWLDKMGQMAAVGVSRVFRQSLCGDYDGLISSALQPRPSYWAMVLFKRLVGSVYLKSSLSSTTPPFLRVHAYCAKRHLPHAGTPFDESWHQQKHWVTDYPAGSVVLTFVNLHPTQSVPLHIEGLQGTSSPRDEYVLSSDAMDGERVIFNGIVELTAQEDGTLPLLGPQIALDESPPTVPPLSCGFIVLPNARASACIA